MNELVSIIMPVYNSEKFIERTLKSVIQQKYTHWELVLIDDCSKDNSRKIIEQYSQTEPRIVPIFKATNSGSADSRNKGIEVAKGRYIALLDSDDLWDSNFLSKQVQFIQKHNAAFAFSSFRMIDEDDQPILKDIIITKTKIKYRDNLPYNRIGSLTAIYDSKVLGKMYFDVSLKSVRDDYALWLDILKKIDYAYGNKEVLASYRIRKGAITASKKKMVLPHYRLLRDREKLSFIEAFVYTFIWAMLGVKKYYLNKLARAIP